MLPLTQRLHSLPYFTDSAALFAGIAQRPWSMFLDSGYPAIAQGRYDILSCDPRVTLVTRGNLTEIRRAGGVEYSSADPFTLLKQILQEKELPAINHLPFNGGALGYFAYDLARRIEELPQLALDVEGIPDMAVGIYPWAVIVDHQLQQSWLVGQDIADDDWQTLIAQFSCLTEASLQSSFQVTGAIVSHMPAADYAAAFHAIKTYLKEGDCYQVNLAQRFSAPCQGQPWHAYQALRKLNPAPFGGYFNIPEVQILCSSPERFLRVQDGAVETKPIKGTRVRKADPLQDQHQINQLANSAKDRAENVMIVDLLRNDLSKNCRLDSVAVPKLFAIESYTTVHHLVSTVTGQLAENQHPLDLLRNCFPGGSITGAPKIRAMEIIEELETHRRGVYCGAMGYIGFDGNMDTNIVIRTLVHVDNNISCWAGGGIVNDSVLEEEYQESFDKAEALLRLLRSLMHESH